MNQEAGPTFIQFARVGEMAGIKVRGLDGITGTSTFWDEKVNRKTYPRRVGPWALKWVRFFHRWAIRKLGRTQHDKIFSGPRQPRGHGQATRCVKVAGGPLAWMARTLRDNSVAGRNPHA